MSTILPRRTAAGLVIVATAWLSGCIVADGGYGYGYDGADQGYGVGYYEPGSVAIGRWGQGYQVAPYRTGGYRGAPSAGRSTGHAYAAAPTSHATPSIPSRPRPSASTGHDSGERR